VKSIRPWKIPDAATILCIQHFRANHPALPTPSPIHWHIAGLSGWVRVNSMMSKRGSRTRCYTYFLLLGLCGCTGDLVTILITGLIYEAGKNTDFLIYQMGTDQIDKFSEKN
jgi:hypothetical protein